MVLDLPGKILDSQNETVTINRAGTDIDAQLGRSVSGEGVKNKIGTTAFGAGGETSVWSESVPAGEKWILQGIIVTALGATNRHDTRVVVTTGNVTKFIAYFTGEGNWDFPGFELNEGAFTFKINASAAETFKWNVIYVVKKI